MASHQEMVDALNEAQWTTNPDDFRHVVAQYVRLTDGKGEPAPPAHDTTIDGVPVSSGMRVWDYNLDATTVVGVDHLDPHSGAWWYRTSRTPGVGAGDIFDAKRMWFRHPTTGVSA
jgi:hypothetical protein